MRNFPKLVITCILLLMFAPALVPIAVQFISLFLVVMTLWFIILAVIGGAVAGLSAGLVLRRRPRPRHRLDYLPRGRLPRF